MEKGRKKEKKRAKRIKRKPIFIKTYSCIPDILSVLHVLLLFNYLYNNLVWLVILSPCLG